MLPKFHFSRPFSIKGRGNHRSLHIKAGSGGSSSRTALFRDPGLFKGSFSSNNGIQSPLVRSQIRLNPGASLGVRHLSVETVTETIAPLKQTLEACQAASGLSWPVFIPLATVVVRTTFTAPLAVWNRLRARRQRSIQPILGASVPVIKAQLAQSVVRNQAQLTPEQIIVLAAKERRKRRVKLYREFKCQNWKVLLLPLVQIPVFCAMSLAVRSLVGFDLSAVTEFGNVDASRFLWFRNMVEPDPYGIIPLSIGAFSLANVEMNARAAISGSPAGISAGSAIHQQKHNNGPSIAAALANVSRAGSVVFMALSFQAPMALELYWLSSNLYSFVQNMLLEKYLPVRDPITYPKLDSRVMESSAV